MLIWVALNLQGNIPEFSSLYCLKMYGGEGNDEREKEREVVDLQKGRGKHLR